MARSVRFLQEGLNLLNLNQRYYADLDLDGRLGDMTLAALASFLRTEEGQPDYLLKCLSLLQGCSYLETLRTQPRQQKFARGWLNRVDLR